MGRYIHGFSLCPNCFAEGYHGFCDSCGFDGKMKNNSLTLSPGAFLLDRYVIGRVIGVGGFGATYAALDVQKERKVAIKEYLPRKWVARSADRLYLQPYSDEFRRHYAHGLNTFLNESKMLKAFFEDRHIVKVFDSFEDDGTAYMVMEYIDGETISSFMKRRQYRFEQGDAADIMCQLANSLIGVHSTRLLHRDISPENIMLQYDALGYSVGGSVTTSSPTSRPMFDVKLIDFGAARVNVASDMTVLYKPCYTPIEQYSKDGNQGTWTDVYALCATCFYMVTGTKPPQAHGRTKNDISRLLLRGDYGLSEEFIGILAAGMEEEITNRTQDMHTLLKEMSRFVKEDSVYRRDERTRPVDRRPELREMTRDSDVHVIEIHGERVGNESPKITVMTPVGTWRWSFGFNERVIIGRKNDLCNIAIQNTDGSISRQHCEIRYIASQHCFLVKDISKYGTFYHGKKIGRQNTARVPVGESIELVSSQIRLLLEVM